MVEEQQSSTLVAMNAQQFIRIAIAGALVGAATWGLTWLLDTYILRGIVCHGLASMQCLASLTYANISASILAGGLGLLALVKLQVYRSLLVVIAVTVSLWGLAIMTRDQDWATALVISVLAFLVSYLLFSWVARLRQLALTLVIILALVAGVRFVLNL